MNKMNEKKKEVEKQLQDKLAEFNSIEQQRNDVSQEILRLQGQLQLLEELCQKEQKQ